MSGETGSVPVQASYKKYKKNLRSRIMAKKRDKITNKLLQYWKKVMNSTRKSMSLGAQHVDKIITWARQDNWRRPHNRPKKK